VLDRSGIQLGQNIFKADTQAAAKKLRTNPWISTASVRRELPGIIRIGQIGRAHV